MSNLYPKYANKVVAFYGPSGNEISIHLDEDGRVTSSFVYTFIRPDHCTLTDLNERQIAELLEGDFEREVSVKGSYA